MSDLLKGIQDAAANPVGAATDFAKTKLTGAKQNGMGNIDDFRGIILSDGIQKANRYGVTIELPQVITSKIKDKSYMKRIGLMCGQATIPGKNVRTREMTGSGTPYKVGEAFEYEDLSLSFLILKDHAEEALFNYWQNQIFSNKTGHSGYYRNYVSNIKVYPLDERDNQLYVYIFEECYPISVSLSEYGNEADGVATMTVTFAYRRYAGDNQVLPNPMLAEQTEENGILSAIRGATKLVGAIDSTISSIDSLKNRFK